MKTLLLGALLATAPFLGSPAFECGAEYTAAAISAAMSGNFELVEHLVNSGADPNGRNAKGHSLLTYGCLQHCEVDATEPRFLAARIKHVKFLISKGAQVNVSDSFGVVPLVAADRVGSKELMAVLKENGALNLEWDDLPIKAAATLVDGEILQNLLDRLQVENGSMSLLRVVPYEALKVYLTGTTIKVGLADGKDLFGRPFVLSTEHTFSVVNVAPETKRQLAKGDVINPDYWKLLREPFRCVGR